MTDQESSAVIAQAQVMEHRGLLDPAEAEYERVLKQRPGDAPAHFCLGMLWVRQNKREAGIQLIEQAVLLRPDEGIFRINLAAILSSVGEIERALSHARRAWELLPNSVEAAHNLGSILFTAGQYEAAIAPAEAATKLAPGAWDVHANLGSIFAKLDRVEKATELFERVVSLKPDHQEALLFLVREYLGRGVPSKALPYAQRLAALQPDDAATHLLLGIALKDFGLPEPATRAFTRCLQLNPRLWEASLLLGYSMAALQKWSQAADAFATVQNAQPLDLRGFEGLVHALRLCQSWDDAIAATDRAMQYESMRVHAMAARAEIYRDQVQLDAAIELAGKVLLIDPHHLKANLVLGCAYLDLAKYDLAGQLFDAAILEHPDSPLLRFHRSVLRLTLGKTDGWDDYEYRLKMPGTTSALPQTQRLRPVWHGENLAGKTLLLYQEQGLGDFLQCLRGLEELAGQSQQVIVLVSPALALIVPQFKNVRIISTPAQIPRADFQIGEMSLPRLLGWTPTSPPAPLRYLAEPSTELLAHWQQRLSALEGFRIGVAWTGSFQQLQNHRRLIPLQMFDGLAKTPGIHLISLQVGPGLEQVREVSFPVFNASVDFKSLADTAAVIRQLDLVVTVDTSVAHLAGAMGAPVWTLLSKVCDFRWLLDRDTSPWYPSMRLFRQQEIGQWSPVMAAVEAQILQLIDESDRKPHERAIGT